LRHYFSSSEFRESICADVVGVGGSLTRAQPKRVAAFLIPLAPLPEQRRIAAKLDALLGRVEACRDRLDAVPRLLKRFRQAVLAAATSGELTAEWREKRGNESSWTETSLSTCFNVFSGFAFKKNQYSASGSKLLQIANVGYGYTIWEDVNYVPEGIADTTYCNFKLKADDIVMALNRPITNGLLKVAQISYEDLPSTIYQRVACLRLKLPVNKQYIFYSLQTLAFLRQVEKNLQGSDQPYINTSSLAYLTLNLPSLKEQHEIVRRVEALFAVADKLEARYATARKQVDQLTPALLAKAFRGELVPQDPADEPAPALLARIRAEREAGGQAALFEAGVKGRRKGGRIA